MHFLKHVVALGLMMVVGASAGHSQGAAPPAVPVTVAPPLAKRITNWDEYSGRVEAVARVDLRARVSGFIEKVHFKDGAMVNEGDLLFTLDKRPFNLAVESGKAEVARQQAQVDFAQADLKRAEPLAASRVMSEQVFEQRKATLDQNVAQLMAARAALQTAELNLEWAEVRAPVSGRISDRKVDPGNLVGGGTPDASLLATIVSLDPIHFLFEVSEADYLRYARQGLLTDKGSTSPVKIKLADEADWSHEGTMDFVDNALNDRSGTLRGRAIIQNKDRLLTPGVFARLALFSGESDALLVPDASVVSDQARKIVFTVNAEDVVVPAPVTLGPIVDGLRVIKTGIKPDDRIVIEGLANPMVRPGAKVAPTAGAIKTAQNQK